MSEIEILRKAFDVAMSGLQRAYDQCHKYPPETHKIVGGAIHDAKMIIANGSKHPIPEPAKTNTFGEHAMNPPVGVVRGLGPDALKPAANAADFILPKGDKPLTGPGDYVPAFAWAKDFDRLVENCGREEVVRNIQRDMLDVAAKVCRSLVVTQVIIGRNADNPYALMADACNRYILKLKDQLK